MVTLSFDIGTTNINAVLIKGNVKINEVVFGVDTKKDGKKMTQDPLYILETIKKTIEEMQQIEKINYVVLSTPMHTLIKLDKNYHPTQDMIIWSDRRSEFVFEKLDSKERMKLYQNTGTPLHSMSPLSKLMILENDAAYISDLKAFLMVHLTGEYVTDFCSASASGMWNMNLKEWNSYSLKLANIRKNQLPKLVEIDTQFKGKEFSLVIGATDGVLSNISLGKKDSIVVNIGTSVGVRMISEHQVLNKGFCYYAGFDRWLIGNASNNGGNVYNWINETFCYGKLSFQEMIEILEKPLTNELCIPYVYGERGPWWIDGLTYHAFDMPLDDRIQSLIFSMLTNIYLMIKKIYTNNQQIYVTGGFLKDKKMQRIFCDFIGNDVNVLKEDISIHQASLSLITDKLLNVEELSIKHKDRKEYENYRQKSSDYITNYIEEYKNNNNN